MDLSTRLAIVIWSAVPGLILGLLIGGGLWVVLQLLGELVPGVAALVQRWQTPLVVLCFVLVPLFAIVVGALEGWKKQA